MGGFIKSHRFLFQKMMKHIQLYVFSQDKCPPCQRLKDHIATLPCQWQQELHIVPFKGPNGEPTLLAQQLGVTLTPTLVATVEGVQCELWGEGEEDCTYTEEVQERIVGANAIIEALPTTIASYTYAADTQPLQTEGPFSLS